jgi:hypothetical protein
MAGLQFTSLAESPVLVFCAISAGNFTTKIVMIYRYRI